MNQQSPPAPPVPRWIKIFVAAAFGLLALVVVLIIVANAFAPAEPEAAPVAASPAAPLVAKADGAIRGVADSAEYFVIDFKPEPWTAGDRVFSAGNAVKAIGRAMQLGAADKGRAPMILLTVTADMIDRLGGESEQIILSLYFRRTDLEAANFDNLSVGRTLNLATDIRFDRHGAEDLAAYCASERGLGQSRLFCALAASKVPA